MAVGQKEPSDEQVFCLVNHDTVDSDVPIRAMVVIGFRYPGAKARSV